MAYKLTAARLREVIHYDPEIGIFRWREPRPNRSVGSVAGYFNSGYWKITIDGENLKAHRLAWLYVHGQWPMGMIDHINGDPIDNRLRNLRDVERFENAANRPFLPNRQGHVGISLDRGGRWVARVSYNGARFYLGTFKTKEEAIAAYREARKRFRGELPHPERPEPPASPPDLSALPKIEPEPFSVARLRRLLSYDPNTGIFLWRHKRANQPAGKRAGYTDKARGYHYINIDKVRYYAHRLAWLYAHGEWPKIEIDHINGDAGDNRLTNLRQADSLENKCNRRVSRRSASGIKGVHLDPRRGTWSAEIKRGNIRKRMSGFRTAETAAEAYRQAAIELHGEFARSE